MRKTTKIYYSSHCKERLKISECVLIRMKQHKGNKISFTIEDDILKCLLK